MTGVQTCALPILRATAALLVLEEAASRREQAQAREALKRGIARGGPAAAAAAAGLRDLLSDGAWAGRPALLLAGGGYGLPQAAERERLAAALARDDARLRNLRDRLHVQGRQWLPPPQLARLEAAGRNLVLLGQRLRAMHAASGPDA